jgi:hypothetical protein
VLWRVQVFLTSVVLSCSAATGRAATEIPFTREHGMIWIQVTLADHPRPFDFLLDSGAGATLVDSRAARQCGIGLGKRTIVHGIGGRSLAHRAEKTSARVHGIRVPAPELVLDLGAVSQSCGKRIDGLIGVDFFAGRIVQIDFAASKLRLLSPQEFPNGAPALPLARRNGVLCLAAGVNGVQAKWLRLDTGCSSAVEYVTREPGRTGMRKVSVAARHGSSRASVGELLVGSLRCTGVSIGLHDKPFFPGESGLIGNGFLSRYRTTIDHDRKRIAFEGI